MRPLAYRIRPTKIEDVIGQEHLLGENKPIRKMVENKQLSSMLLFGPPGIGKTTIAQSIAGSTDIPFRSLNAVTSGKKDLETIGKEAIASDTSILLYIDEIHRYSKTQIEYLLPFMESGEIIVIGSTTESVFHSLPAAILSRSSIFELKPLSSEQISIGLKRAISDKVHGLGKFDVEYDDEAILFMAETTGGDMRSALNTLESVVISNLHENKVSLSVEMAEKFIEKKHLGYNGETTRYNLMSSMQKSIRNSDVDASLYYLAQLLESGDLPSIHRRLLVIADEDIGLANSNASTHVLTAVTISERVGLPEARITLAKAVIELCLSPKSNSAYTAIDVALATLKTGESYEPPRHLLDAHYAGAKTIGAGQGYLYPHNYPVQKLGAWVNQQCLPDKLVGTKFYSPNEVGHERAFADMYHTINEAKKRT
ncbi:replication-associated recombination protein A [[Brevibacterium] frigoritolerans]|nr:replication-associated recombination protein A [Peribacillus frigoritolerans]